MYLCFSPYIVGILTCGLLGLVSQRDVVQQSLLQVEYVVKMNVFEYVAKGRTAVLFSTIASGSTWTSQLVLDVQLIAQRLQSMICCERARPRVT